MVRCPLVSRMGAAAKRLTVTVEFGDAPWETIKETVLDAAEEAYRRLGGDCESIVCHWPEASSDTLLRNLRWYFRHVVFSTSYRRLARESNLDIGVVKRGIHTARCALTGSRYVDGWTGGG